MTLSKHLLLSILTAILALLLAVGVLVGLGVRPRANDAIQHAAIQAAIQAATVPDRTCNDGGYMGCSAPIGAFASADALAKAAGDPDDVTTPIGVDVFDGQGCAINWTTEANAGVKFAFFKATQSTTDTDECLAHNVTGAKAAKLPYGVYDFLEPGESTATAEADHFVAVVKADDADTSLPPVADVEVSNGETPTQVTAYVKTWIMVVKAGLGRTPLVYTGAWFWSPYLGAQTFGVDLWVSGYAVEPILPSGWRSYTFWQYASGDIGPTPHFGTWDADTFNGTMSQLDALTGVATPAAKPVKPKATVRLGVVVGRYHDRPKARAGYLKAVGLGNGWWEFKPDRTAGKGDLLVGRSHSKPKLPKGYKRVSGLGDGWWEYVPVKTQ